MNRISRKTVSVAVAAFVAGSTASVPAWANTEPPAAYDARSVALGGTGAAYIHNGASIYHNPAALDGIDKLAITADLSLSRPKNTVPLNGPGTSVESAPTIFPMFLVGGGVRIIPPLVLGIAVFPSAGFGSVYKNVASAAGPVDLQQKVMILETTPSVSLRLLDGLSIGVGYRITYATQTAEQLTPLGPPGPATPMGKMRVDLSGTNTSGFHVGLLARPFRHTRIGLTYRNKYTMKLDGTMEVAGASQNAHTELPMPHSYRVGLAQGLFDDSLLLVAEVKRSLYAEADKQLVTRVDTPQGPQEMVIPLDWRNTWTAGFGAEYLIHSRWALRLGYSISQSASSEKRASYYFPPPALLNTVHGGVGAHFQTLDVDFGTFYSFGGKQVAPEPGPPVGSNPGRYETTFLMFALSATYHR